MNFYLGGLNSKRVKILRDVTGCDASIKSMACDVVRVVAIPNGIPACEGRGQ